MLQSAPGRGALVCAGSLRRGSLPSVDSLAKINLPTSTFDNPHATDDTYGHEIYEAHEHAERRKGSVGRASNAQAL